MGWLGEVEVPEGLIEIFQRWKVEGCKMDCEKCNSFNDCLSQFMSIERYDIYPDYIYPEDIAKFTANYVCECARYGYDGYDGISFQNNMKMGDWVVIVYGIIPYGDGAPDWEPHMLAYRSHKHVASTCSGVKEIEDFDGGVSPLITIFIMRNLIETNRKFKEEIDGDIMSLLVGWKAAKAILDSKQWRDQIPHWMRLEFKEQFLEAGRLLLSPS